MLTAQAVTLQVLEDWGLPSLRSAHSQVSLATRNGYAYPGRGDASSVMYIYRRVVLLAGAHAHIQPMARMWGVLIYGHIGRNELHALECYPILPLARARRQEVNRDGCALITSIDEILYPLSLIEPKWDTNLNTDMPSLPPLEKEVASGPHQHVEDLFDVQRIMLKRAKRAAARARAHAHAHYSETNN